MDQDHRAAEPFELLERLAFGGLDHERATDGKGHRRRMESVVDQPLGDVVDSDVRIAVHGSCVDDALVGDESIVAGIENGVVVFEFPSDIIGAEDGDLRGSFQTFGSHHPDVHPGDRQNASRAECGG